MTPPLVEARDVTKHFPLARSLMQSIRRAPSEVVHAVDGVSLEIHEGETLGLIGESGSGKTTLGWVLAKLHTVTSGRIFFDGRDITKLSKHDLLEWRRNIQVVFQDPVGSLDPRLRVWQIVGEPIQAQSQVTKAELRDRVSELLPLVGLPTGTLDQYPHEFSGGGRQRLSLARALSVRPRLIVLDEPTSALDVAVQAQVLNRLVSLQEELDLSYLLITHNVAAVRYVADRVAVMYLGQIAEIGPVRDLLEHPVHPYTKALLAALPQADPGRRRARYRISGEIPTLVHPPPGCRFAPRCPFVVDRCRTEAPPLREVPQYPGRQVACHRAEEIGDVPPEQLLVTVTDSGTQQTAPGSS
ncbi:MAG TPA: oligopeptide/dipeptide ABC transporter ATP-binding protein [Thermoplasmata archaeon]|nr:oligopeptide/dipeptide ABC transporter ATP-binding protein [Thermoplasmata archaeon]